MDDRDGDGYATREVVELNEVGGKDKCRCGRESGCLESTDEITGIEGTDGTDVTEDTEVTEVTEGTDEITRSTECESKPSRLPE